ncbi:MAG: N-6 DNA methylase [Evtepia gabavorous]
MYRFEEEGRAAVVVPDGFLFGLDNAKVNIKKKLISQFNLHTVVRLPALCSALTPQSPPICCFLTTPSRPQRHGFIGWIFRPTESTSPRRSPWS